MRPERVLLPVDLSATAELGVREGLLLAARLGVTVEVLHVADPRLTVQAPAPEHERGLPSGKIEEARLNAWLTGILAGRPQGPVLTLRTRIAVGDPAAVILEEARASDLLVLGTHGRRGLERLLFGSVAERVVRKAPCPVITARAGARTRLSPKPRVMVAVDMSATSRAALEVAASYTAALGGELEAVHVSVSARSPTGEEVGFVGATVAKSSLQDWARAQALEELKAFAPELVVGHRTTVLLGDPVDRLLDHTRLSEAELLIIGTHGRSGLTHLLVGSVAEELVRSASCPVMIVRA